MLSDLRAAVASARSLLQPPRPDPSSPEGQALQAARERRAKELELRAKEAADAAAAPAGKGKAASPVKGKVPAAAAAAPPLPDGVQLGSDESLPMDASTVAVMCALFDLSSASEAAGNRVFCGWLRDVASLL